MLITLRDLNLHYGVTPLLVNANLVIQRGERVCIVGRNGCGKSSLLKVIAGEVAPDSGERILAQHCKIARLEQAPPLQPGVTVYEYVATGLGELGQAVIDYRRLLNATDEHSLNQLHQAQQYLEKHHGWQALNQVESLCSKLGLPADATLNQLSGGWRRRADLARTLVSEPDVLLLDEPTNHLDVATITWLEEFLAGLRICLVFISHDRAFIRKLATRIVDLDRGQLRSFEGSFADYLANKAHVLEVEQTQNALFDKHLADEEVWIRQGIKARRTRNEGRVRALKALRVERSARINQVGDLAIAVEAGQKSGKLVFEVNDLSFKLGEQQIAQHFSALVQRGDKIALVGANGVGKTTLIKLLLGELNADVGRVRQGVNLEVAYFDQHRSALDNDKLVMDAVADGQHELTINGNKRHVLSYLGDFLFSPLRCRAPVSTLSGGERNRLLLAKLLLKPCNLLILDEPTNDLDVETLEHLENLLVDFTGTVLLVSHDREFVDNVATTTWWFDGSGQIEEYVGGYSDAAPKVAQKQQLRAAAAAQTDKVVEVETVVANKSSRKLSNKYVRELEQLPQKLETLEQKIATLQQQVAAAGFFEQSYEQTQPVLDALSAAETELEAAFARWEELEAMANEYK